MGNSMCFHPGHCSTVKVISYGGGTRILSGKRLAGEIIFQFPDQMLCHADSFFIGHQIPSLDIDDELVGGQTYILLPLDCFANKVLSVSSFAGLGSRRSKTFGTGRNCWKDCPFEYVKDCNGRVLIKVVPDFIARLISSCESEKKEIDNSGKGVLCSTPELQKRYSQLVGCREQIWSPKLETISEVKIRFSPCRFIGLQWKEKEV